MISHAGCGGAKGRARGVSGVKGTAALAIQQGQLLLLFLGTRSQGFCFAPDAGTKKHWCCLWTGLKTYWEAHM